MALNESLPVTKRLKIKEFLRFCCEENITDGRVFDEGVDKLFEQDGISSILRARKALEEMAFIIHDLDPKCEEQALAWVKAFYKNIKVF